MKLSLLIILLAATGLFAQSVAQKTNAVENGLFEARDVVFEDSIVPKYAIRDRMKLHKVPAVSVAIINDGQIEWAKTYGVADLQTARKADGHTLFQAASLSKTANTFLILRLAEKQKLSLDKNANDYLKNWQIPDSRFSGGDAITLRNLLNHTSGLGTSGFRGYSKTESLPELEHILNGTFPANNEAVKPIAFANSEFKYSGGGTTVTRKIIEDVLLQDYKSVIESWVLSPLEMSDSNYFQPLPIGQKNFAAAYDENQIEIPYQYHVYPELAPDGLWTTATDFAKLVIEIQNALAGKSKLLSKESAVEMLTPAFSGSALGCFILEKPSEKYFFHTGANEGYRSVFYGSFHSGKGIVLLTNSDNGEKLNNEIVQSVAHTYRWKGFYTPKRLKVIELPNSEFDKYTGVYTTDDGAMKITITKNENGLELFARQKEKLHPVGRNNFVLLSSPSDDCVFSSAKNDGNIDTFQVKQGETVILQAKK